MNEKLYLNIKNQKESTMHSAFYLKIIIKMRNANLNLKIDGKNNYFGC